MLTHLVLYTAQGLIDHDSLSELPSVYSDSSLMFLFSRAINEPVFVPLSLKYNSSSWISFGSASRIGLNLCAESFSPIFLILNAVTFMFSDLIFSSNFIVLLYPE
ncbi:hypothetical protein DCBHLPFO_00677 [Mycoplasmopsis arginini]|uniref:Uncharacterized protein n=1 Tax=Mycoplasmopsis arginini TaxID=2094 RepID=A0AA43U009_MYCAR|nr:hypothetical protein [Mycoplasmopsis arginini]